MQARTSRYGLTFLITVLLCLAAAVPVLAVGVVSGQYLEKSATGLRLEIRVGSPTPTSLILIQHLPPGTRVRNAAPAYKKYNPAKGEVRWLMRNLRPGVFTVRLDLETPVQPSTIRAEIRCKDPETGKMVTTKVE